MESARPQLPHPVTTARSREDIARDFVTIAVDRCPDPRWHFRTAVHRTSRMGPQGNVAPTPQHPMQTLVLLNREDPSCDIEVGGFLMPREFHPADWLDMYLKNQNLTVVSRKPIPMSAASGQAGDCVCTWKVSEESDRGTEEREYAGRYVALKWDNRLFLLGLRTPAEHYPALAEDFFLVMANFQPSDTGNRIPLAQETVQVSGGAPVAWQTLLPDSWTVSSDVVDEKMSSFQAQCRALENTPDRNPFGHLSFAMADRSLASDAKDAAQKFIDAASEGGATFEQDWFQKEPAPAGFRSCHLFASPGRLKVQPQGQVIPVEFRCRILEHEAGWFTAGLTGPRREDSPVAWMHNKRSLDLLTGFLELPT
jgi:hypothetical protein